MLNRWFGLLVRFLILESLKPHGAPASMDAHKIFPGPSSCFFAHGIEVLCLMLFCVFVVLVASRSFSHCHGADDQYPSRVASDSIREKRLLVTAVSCLQGLVDTTLIYPF